VATRTLGNSSDLENGSLCPWPKSPPLVLGHSAVGLWLIALAMFPFVVYFAYLSFTH
jgi:hypothetical protein